MNIDILQSEEANLVSLINSVNSSYVPVGAVSFSGPIEAQGTYNTKINATPRASSDYMGAQMEFSYNRVPVATGRITYTPGMTAVSVIDSIKGTYIADSVNVVGTLPTFTFIGEEAVFDITAPSISMAYIGSSKLTVVNETIGTVDQNILYLGPTDVFYLDDLITLTLG